LTTGKPLKNRKLTAKYFLHVTVICLFLQSKVTELKRHITALEKDAEKAKEHASKAEA
jgi:hypothetical protein